MPLKIDHFGGVVFKGDLSAIPDGSATACTALTKNSTLQPIKKPTPSLYKIKQNSKTVYFYTGKAAEQVVSQTPEQGSFAKPDEAISFTVVVVEGG